MANTVQLNGGNPITASKPTTLKVTPAVPGAGSSLGTAVPIDAQGQIALQQAAIARQAYEHQIAQQQQAANLGYTQQVEDLTRQHPLDQASLNNNYGSRGMGFSSGYGIANSRLADVYSTAQAREALSHQQALQGLMQNLQDYNNAYAGNQSAIRQAAADRLSAIAGTLGLTSPTTNAGALGTLLQGSVASGQR